MTAPCAADSMDFWKKEPNSHVLTETDTERFMRFFFSRVLKKQDGSKWEAEELTLLSCLQRKIFY